MSIKKISYDSAGVNIAAGNKLVDSIKPYVKNTNRSGVMGNIGGFGGLFDVKLNYKDPILVSATDGVGTKLKIAIEADIVVLLVKIWLLCVLVGCTRCRYDFDYYTCVKLNKIRHKKL